MYAIHCILSSYSRKEWLVWGLQIWQELLQYCLFIFLRSFRSEPIKPITHFLHSFISSANSSSFLNPYNVNFKFWHNLEFGVHFWPISPSLFPLLTSTNDRFYSNLLIIKISSILSLVYIGHSAPHWLFFIILCKSWFYFIFLRIAFHFTYRIHYLCSRVPQMYNTIIFTQTLDNCWIYSFLNTIFDSEIGIHLK